MLGKILKEAIEITASKHPKHDNAPLILTKSNIEFNHKRKFYDINEETKEISGACGFVDFMESVFISGEKTLSNDVLKFLIDESSEARTDPEIFKDLIQKKKVKEYVESFKNKRKDSNEYIKAVHFLKTYFDDSNKKTIDL